MKHDCNMYIHPNQARGLSPREAARIQTFPDYYVFKGTPNYWYARIEFYLGVTLSGLAFRSNLFESNEQKGFSLQSLTQICLN